jgi:protein SCO1
MKTKTRVIKQFSLLFLIAGIAACDESTKDPGLLLDTTNKLGYFGEFEEEMVHNADGTISIDTIYYPIPKFSFINQDGQVVTHRIAEGKVVVSDFFFTHCKSICPVISSQMARLQVLVEKEGLSDKVIFLSHSVDPVQDRPDTLKNYAKNLGADLKNWQFLTVDTANFDPSYVFDLAQDGYYLTAFPSDTAEGGIFHTDQLALLDKTLRIRGYYDGMSTAGVDKLFNDLKILLNESDKVDKK